jgi:hypothetical protein
MAAGFWFMATSGRRSIVPSGLYAISPGGAKRDRGGVSKVKLRHNVKHHAQVILLSHATEFSWRMRRCH